MGWVKKAMTSRQGKVGLTPLWAMIRPQAGGMAKRVADETEFYAETQRGFYADMAAFYHDTLGCRQLINACNWKTADPIKLGDIERWTYTSTDVIAVNRYYNGGTHTGSQSNWRIDPGDHFSQQSALLNPRGLPVNLKQVAGYPMIVTESSWVSPIAYQSEGPFLIAVYQSLSGIDAFIWFMASQPEYALGPDRELREPEWPASPVKMVGLDPGDHGGIPRRGSDVPHGLYPAGCAGRPRGANAIESLESRAADHCRG